MNDPYHCVMETRNGRLAAGMRQLNGVSTQRFNRRHARGGHERTTGSSLLLKSLWRHGLFLFAVASRRISIVGDLLAPIDEEWEAGR